MGGVVGTAYVELEADLRKLDAGLRQAVPEAERAGQQAAQAFGSGFGSGVAGADLDRALSNVRRTLDSFGSDLQGLGTTLSIGVTAPLVAFGAAAISSAADIDALKRGLAAVTGSATEAERQFVELREVARLPGLGLEEAARGATNLQAFGFSAIEAKNILLEFGNALASVGRGRAELDRVILQLGQMAGAGKVLQQDLRPIITQVPQVAEIIKRNFGPEALSAPAETLQNLGITSREFIATLVTELGKLPRVTGGIKNDLENFADTVKIALADVGGALAPFVSTFVSQVTPAIQNAARAFAQMSPDAQKAAVGLAAMTAAAGPLLLVLGSLSRAFSDVLGVASRLRDVLPGVASNLGGVGAAVGAIHVAGLDRDFLALWNAVNQAWRDVADDLDAVAGSLRAIAELTGLGPIVSAIDSLATILGSIAGIDLSNFLSLERLAKTALGPLGLLGDAAKNAAAGIQVLSGHSKSMEDALYGASKAQADANAKLREHASELEKAQIASAGVTQTIHQYGEAHAAATPRVREHTRAQSEHAKAVDEAAAALSRAKFAAETTVPAMQGIRDIGGGISEEFIKVRSTTEDVGDTMIRVLRGSGVPVLNEVQAAAEAVTNAFTDMNGAIKELPAHMRALSDASVDYGTNAAAAARGARDTPFDASIAGQYADALQLVVAAASYENHPQFLSSRGTGPGTWASSVAPSFEALNSLINGIPPGTILMDTRRQMDRLTDSIGEMGVEAKNASDLTEKVGISMEVENEQRRLHTGAADELQAEMGRVFDRMQELRDAGADNTDEFRALQDRLRGLSTELNTLNGIAPVVAQSVASFGEAARGAVMGFDEVNKALVNTAVVSAAVATSMARGATMPVLPGAAMPEIPVSTPGSQARGAVLGSITSGPGGPTIQLNVNGGTFSSTSFVNEVMPMLTDALRRDVGLKL